jgi:DNA-binding MarR family transcriptional regulator
MPNLPDPDEDSGRPACAATFYIADEYQMTDSIGHQLFRLMVGVKREIDWRMSQVGLTDAQWKPLWILRQGRISTSFELAREMEIDAGATTRMLDRLEAKGLIERTRSETDRRVVNIALTTAGNEVTAHVPGVLASVNNDYLRGFSEAEWTQMKSYVSRMQANGAEMIEAKNVADSAAVKGGE